MLACTISVSCLCLVNERRGWTNPTGRNHDARVTVFVEALLTLAWLKGVG